MVKFEALPDYYADLDLRFGADTNEVKKQYRKLALKYHPDRNPGHEQEFAIKFQAIQSAHEILTDTTARAKYDAQRVRHGFATTPVHATAFPSTSSSSSTSRTGRPSVPPRTKTSATSTASNFPPPPRPPPYHASTATGRTPTASAFASTTSSRSARYSRAEPAWASNGTNSDDIRAKTTAFKAWEQMKHGQSAGASSTTSSGTSATNPPPPPRRPVPPQSPRTRVSFEAEHASPTSAMPASTPNTSSARKGRKWEETRDAGMPNLSRSNTASGRVPQQAHPASKSSNLRSSLIDPSDPSLPTRPPYFTSSTAEYPAKSPGGRRTASEMPPPPPRRAPTSKRDSLVPPSGSHLKDSASAPPTQRSSTPYHSTGGERTYVSSPMTSRPMDTVDGNSLAGKTNARENASHASSVTSNLSGRQSANGSSAPPVEVESASSSSSSQSSSSGDDAVQDELYTKRPTKRIPKSQKARMAAHNRYAPFSPHLQPHDAQDQKQSPLASSFGAFKLHPNPGESSAKPTAATRNPSFQDGPSPLSTQPVNHAAMNSPKPNVDGVGGGQPIFSFAPSSQDSSFNKKTGLARETSGSIDINFSPSRAPPRFGAENSYFPSQDNSDGSQAHLVSSPQAPKDSLPTAYSFPDSNGTSTTPLASPDAPNPPLEDWNQAFVSNPYDLGSFRSGSRSGYRARGTTRRMTSSGRLSRNKAAFPPSGLATQSTVVGSEKEQVGATSATTPQEPKEDSSPEARDVNAMDIDSSPQGPPPSEATIGQGKDVGESESSEANSKPFFPSSEPPKLPPRNNHGPSNSLDSGRPTSSLNLSDFRNVAPFSATSKAGLKDVTDLESALPFPSQPSLFPHISFASTNSTGSQPASTIFDKCLKKLDLPKLPKAPSPPTNLTPDTWERYLADMNAYIFRWNGFTAQMLLLFQRRQEEHRELGPAWVGQVGGDCEAYLRALDEDERARKYWEVASDFHRDCFRKLQKTRQSILSTHPEV